MKKINFVNKPNTTTPINDTNLNKMQDNIEEAINEIPMKVLSNGYDIDTLKKSGTYGIFNATGSLPTGYSTSDNNIFIECYMWGTAFGRQVFHDVRTNKIFYRILSNDVWQEWASDDYFTKETFTGKYWMDGKKIYRKVINIGQITFSIGDNNFAHGISNLETVVDINYSMFFASANQWYTYWSAITGKVATSSDIILATNGSNTFYHLKITIEYTKTTN